MARKPATLSAYKPTLREQLAILGEKGYTALTGNEPGYEARDLINRYTGLADLLDVPGIALSASDAARSIGTRQYPQAVADVAGMALGAIPIAGPALKGAGKKLVKKGAETATRLANVRAPNAIDAGHLEDVITEMRDLGAPTIRVVKHPDPRGGYLAIEGSHRLAAAKKLGLQPRYKIIKPNETLHSSELPSDLTEEFWGSVHHNEQRPDAVSIQDYVIPGKALQNYAATNVGASYSPKDFVARAVSDIAPTVEDLAGKYGAEAGLPAKQSTEDILKELDAQRDIVAEIYKQRETTPAVEDLAGKYDINSENMLESNTNTIDQPLSMADKAREKWAATASKAQRFLDSLGYKGDQFRMMAEHAPHAFPEEFALHLAHSKVNGQKIIDNPQYRGTGLSILQELEASNANLRRHDPSHEYYSHEFFKPSSETPLSTATADVVPLRRPPLTAKAEGGVVNASDLRYKYGIE